MSINDFTDGRLDVIWGKAKIVNSADSPWRKDVAGAWIHRNSYGDNSSETNYGWQVDHIKPLSKGGSNDISNLRPLQWKNNCIKNDDYPVWTSYITSSGDHNVHQEQRWRES